MKVLIVEDSPVEAAVQEARLGLRPTPFRPFTVGSVDLALDHLANEAVDVILLDLGLPDASGVEAVRAIRRSHPEVPIVVSTGTMDEALYRAARAAGATDVTRKGTDSDEHLELRLRAAAATMTARSELAEKRTTPAARALLTDLSLHLRASIDAIGEVRQRIRDGDDIESLEGPLDALEALLDPMRVAPGPDMLLRAVGVCEVLSGVTTPLTRLEVPAADVRVIAQLPSLERAFAILMPIIGLAGSPVPVRWSSEDEIAVIRMHVEHAAELVRQHPLLWTMVNDLLALSMGLVDADAEGITIRLPQA